MSKLKGEKKFEIVGFNVIIIILRGFSFSLRLQKIQLNKNLLYHINIIQYQ